MKKTKFKKETCLQCQKVKYVILESVVREGWYLCADCVNQDLKSMENEMMALKNHIKKYQDALVEYAQFLAEKDGIVVLEVE